MAGTVQAVDPTAGVWPRAVRGPRVPGCWREGIGAATWGSILAVVLLWVGNRGVQQISGLAPGLTSAGRLAGLLAADLLLVQVFLMARVPWVERSYGQDELARRHRAVGYVSFNLLLVHIVLVTVGYALQARINPARQIVQFV